MSEGDTVHHAASRIHAALAGRVPDEILTPHPRHGADGWPELLAGHAVRGAHARGKHLLLRFEGDLTLHSHLRMTGTWGVYERGRRWHRAPHRAWLVIRTGEWEVVQFDGPVLELMSEVPVRLDPWRSVGEMSDELALEVVAFAHEHMNRAARAGRIARPREVYKRAGQRCVRCGSTIRARGQGENNRITFWCPGCQL